MTMGRNAKVTDIEKPAATVPSSARGRAISMRRHGSLLCSGVLATMLLVGLSSTADAARCMRGSNYNLSVEGPWQRYMTVAQGRHCAVSIYTGNKRYPALGGWYLERLNLAQAPSHGSVQIQGLSRYVYAASKDYTGKDQFMVRLCGRSSQQTGCSNFLVDVTVVARNG
jgi:hypothetical protein